MTDEITTTNSGENEDMFKIRDMFSRAADAILAATQLRRDVTALQDSVNKLSTELEAVRNHNTWLEQQLEDTKRNRDEWRDRCFSAENSLEQSRQEVSRLTSVNEDQTRTIHDLNMLVERMRDEQRETEHKRDDLELELMSVNDKLSQVRAVIDDAGSKLTELLFPEEKKEPEPTAQEIVPELVSAPPTPVFEEQIRDPETGQFGPKIAQGF